MALDRVDTLIEVVDRIEGRHLLGQTVDQLQGADARVAGDVVDRLFRIERGALAAERVERVDDLAVHLQHAALEHREQAHRAGADDRDIAAGNGHAHSRTGRLGDIGHNMAAKRLAINSCQAWPCCGAPLGRIQTRTR